jgi:hypothetical protein
MSKDLHNNFDDFFKNSLHNYGEEPPDNLWNNIEKNIPVQKNRKSIDLNKIFTRAAIVIGLLSITYTLYFFNRKLNSISEKLEINSEEIYNLKSQNDSLKYLINITKIQSDTVFLSETIYKTVYFHDDNENIASIPVFENTEENKATENIVADNNVLNKAENINGINENSTDTEILSNEQNADKIENESVLSNSVVSANDYETDSLFFEEIEEIQSIKIAKIDNFNEQNNLISEYSENTNSLTQELEIKKRNREFNIFANLKLKKKDKYSSDKSELFAWLKNIELNKNKKNKEIIAENKVNKDDIEIKIENSENKKNKHVITENNSEGDTGISKKENINNRFSIGLQTAGVFNYRTLKPIHNQQPPNMHNNKEIARFSYETAITFGYVISSKFDIVSGVNYAVVNHQFSNHLELDYNSATEKVLPNGDILTTYSTELQNPYGNSNADLEIIRPLGQNLPPDKINTELITQQKMQKLNIPLILKYHIKTRKFGITLNAGLESSFLIKKTEGIVDLKIENPTLKSGINSLLPNQEPKMTMFSYIIGFGMNFNLYQKINFYLEPTFKSALNNFYKSEITKTKPFSLSICAGVQFYL